jgi:hypothetical protein
MVRNLETILSNAELLPSVASFWLRWLTPEAGGHETAQNAADKTLASENM